MSTDTQSRSGSGDAEAGDILRAEHLVKSYGDRKVLGDVSIRLSPGELVSILGVSGVGKTTLFNILSGLLKPDSGSILLADGEGGMQNIAGETGRLSYMLQKDMLLPHKTIQDNVALPLLLKGMNRKDARAKALSFFDQFGLSGTQEKYPAQLSGGMRQRAALLRTYLCGNRVALLDEPFSALDTLTRTSVQEWYLKVMDEIRMSTLFITHDIDEAILLSDRIYIMKGSPASMTDELVIPTPRPRDRDYMLSEEFLSYKRQIRAIL
ncbi:MAG: ABC transporter ATP-binding protein [Oscillospiraceae bacterium]|nr:ABC transporter ATP-binding protein [Oscillospiraceae bacterium]